MTTKLKISDIRTDGGTQPRAAIDPDVVAEYASAMQAGAIFPPVIVFHDGPMHWLADGFQSLNAAVVAGFKEIDSEVRQGTLEDAQWFSYSANATHGMRRTNEDKQRAVKAALAHSKSSGLSDGLIAKHVGVSDRMIAEYRKELTPKL